MKPMIMFVSTLSILAASSAFALPHRPEGRTERPSAGQYSFGCGTPDYMCQDSIQSEVVQICKDSGFENGEVVSATITGAPKQECFQPRGSFPYCMTFTPYTVIYQCR